MFCKKQIFNANKSDFSPKLKHTSLFIFHLILIYYLHINFLKYKLLTHFLYFFNTCDGGNIKFKFKINILVKDIRFQSPIN